MIDCANLRATLYYLKPLQYFNLLFTSKCDGKPLYLAHAHFILPQVKINEFSAFKSV